MMESPAIGLRCVDLAGSVATVCTRGDLKCCASPTAQQLPMSRLWCMIVTVFGVVACSDHLNDRHQNMERRRIVPAAMGFASTHLFSTIPIDLPPLSRPCQGQGHDRKRKLPASFTIRRALIGIRPINDYKQTASSMMEWLFLRKPAPCRPCGKSSDDIE